MAHCSRSNFLLPLITLMHHFPTVDQYRKGVDSEVIEVDQKNISSLYSLESFINIRKLSAVEKNCRGEWGA